MGAVTGFYVSRDGDVCLEDEWKIYAAAAGCYYVGVLTFQPTAMTSPQYSPVAYAFVTVVGGVVGFLFASGIFLLFFTGFNRFVKWYYKKVLPTR
ncbi:MAG: hypothetical protein ACYC4I_02875 [Minisyncoccota bacterium]